MSCGVMRAAHAYFSSPVLITWRSTAALAGPVAGDPAGACRASPHGALRASNVLKTIANLADATLQAVSVGFFPARRVLACVLHSVRGGGGQVVYTQFRANATTHRAVVPTEDPPFGGLWCDQPAIFLSGRSCRRQLRRARPGRDERAGKKRGFCRRNVGRSGARAFPSAPSLSVSLPCQRRQPSYHRHEGVEINRLGDVEIEAGLDSRGDVAFRCVAGHGDRQHVTSNLQPA